jgi:hypothetical protein
VANSSITLSVEAVSVAFSSERKSVLFLDSKLNISQYISIVGKNINGVQVRKQLFQSKPMKTAWSTIFLLFLWNFMQWLLLFFFIFKLLNTLFKSNILSIFWKKILYK